ncbi:MAG: hypothetical protein M9888_00590 [Chitinophagales bacterium]|nr:hypothetical protein [Chitinophagales bacterium]
MYQIKFTLKQHTPIIHFQHDQVGATLRATEVKPKLDRFILMKLGDRNYEAGREIAKKNGWLIDKDKGALDYKMRIENPKSIIKYFYASNPTGKKDGAFKKIIKDKFEAAYINQTQYFANNSNLKPNGIDKEDEVKLGVYGDVIKASIQSFNEGLKNEVQSILIEFFLSTNFGSRQTKGFGCFTVVEIYDKNDTDNNNNDVKTFDEKDLLKCFSTVYKYTTELEGYNVALQKIASIYSLIRSGHGERAEGGYKKSLLFLYFVGKQPDPVRWEKRKLKQTINSTMYRHQMSDKTFKDIKLTYTHEPCYDSSDKNNWQDIPSSYNYQYIRALLGLNESFEFLADPITDGKRRDHNGNQVDNKLSFKYIAKVKSNNGIDRFASPIVCKFIEGHIYFCANPISPLILNTLNNPVSFNFDLRLKKNNRLQDVNFHKRDDFVSDLKTPNQFHIGDFLEFCFIHSTNKIDDFLKI